MKYLDVEVLICKKHIRILFLLLFVVFILNKLLIRPWVLENGSTEFIRLFVLSVPNLIEAFVGTLLLTGIFLQIRHYFKKHLGSLKDKDIYLIAAVLAGTYSVSQEYNFHNIGGDNVFDIYDVIASIIGLLIAYWIIVKYGFVDTSE